MRHAFIPKTQTGFQFNQTCFTAKSSYQLS